jgi:hypothetical protein
VTIRRKRDGDGKVPQKNWTAVQHLVQEENDKKWKTMDSKTLQERKRTTQKDTKDENEGR